MYLGRGIDQIDNIATLDNLSFNGSDTVFNLTQNSVAFNIISVSALQIQIDGVIQVGNFTQTGGSQITFDFTPNANSVCNSVKHFGVGLLSQPSDGSVNMAQLGASGTKSSSTFLAGDNTFKTVSGTTINNNADNRVITGSGTANTLEGESSLIFSGDALTFTYATNPAIDVIDSTNTVKARHQAGNTSAVFGSASNHPVVFIQGSGEVERMRIETNGVVLINRTSNNGSYPGMLSVNRSTNAITATIENTKTSGLGASILKVISAQNTTNSSYNMIDADPPSGRFLVRDSSNVQNTNNSYGAVSDERIKQDITDASSQWEDIKALKIRNFKLKADTSKTQIGVVAQELEVSNMNGLIDEAPPEERDVALHSDFGTVVSGTADNGATPIYEKDEEGNDTDKITGYENVFTAGENVKSVKYSVLYMKSIKALQEAMEKIETLEAKVTALENA